MNLFDVENLKKLIGPNIQPGKYEAVYTVKQLFETGVEITLSYVIREGKMMIFEEQKRVVKDIVFKNGSELRFENAVSENQGRGYTPLSDWDYLNK